MTAQLSQPDPSLLTVPEACRALRVSRWTVNRLIQNRDLRSIKIGSRRLVPQAAIAEYVEQRSQDAES